MKHRHYDMIMKWVEDTSRQVEYSQNGGRTWHALLSPVWDESVEYRFAPVVLKYRVALFDSGASRWTGVVHNDKLASLWEEDAGNFVRWITDWTEVTETPVETPKPKMKKCERWLNLNSDGILEVYGDPHTAERCARKDRIECRRIEWEVPA